MNIISYNVNGIRAAVTKGFTTWLAEENADIICIQETKAQIEQIPTAEFEQLGYTCYYECAQKKGYSGVAILSKTKPDNIVYGMNNAKYDSEGRVLRADYGDFTLICVYIPSGSSGDIRQEFKMEFLADFNNFIQDLRKTRPNLLICGDYNIAHTTIDINNWKRQVGVSGFLPEEREWLTDFLATGFIDSFRVYDKRPEQYSWWTYRMGARKRNVGWRIDYHLITETLREKLTGASILNDIVHSDHCPIKIELNITQ